MRTLRKLNRNHLKIAACVCMLLDHAGILLFPGAPALRWAGRLAMPLFAFFIGEGCRYTRNRKKYFLMVFLLGLGCQLVYVLEELFAYGALRASSQAWYMNILLTFSAAIPLCFVISDLKRAAAAKDAAKTKKYALLLCLGLTLLACAEALLRYLQGRGWGLCFDYGVWGVLLPASALLFAKPLYRQAVFTLAVLLFCAFTCSRTPYVWFSLLAPALLLFYNGEGGSRRLKYGFYIFYPAHLAALYLIALIFS